MRAVSLAIGPSDPKTTDSATAAIIPLNTMKRSWQADNHRSPVQQIRHLCVAREEPTVAKPTTPDPYNLQPTAYNLPKKARPLAGSRRNTEEEKDFARLFYVRRRTETPPGSSRSRRRPYSETLVYQISAVLTA